MANWPLLPLGQILATPGALQALAAAGESPDLYIDRHVSGDWGRLSIADAAANQSALLHGERLLSSYALKTGQCLWIITEADRSATVLLQPHEY